MLIQFNYKSALIKNELIKKDLDYLASEIAKIKSVISANSNNYSCKYSSIYSFINLIDDNTLFRQITQTVKEVKKLKPTVFILIGIGGSSLGTLAVLEAIYGRFYNNPNNLEFNSKLDSRFYCLDTLDSRDLINILKIAEQELKIGNNIIVNIVTKSGTTTETLVNSLFFVDLVKKYKADYNKYIVVTTDKNSHLWNIAKKENYFILEVPKLAGGRFSVFSAVSLFPLSFLNIDINLLRLGAQQIKNLCLTDNNSNNNIASISAAIIYENYKQNKNINDLFVFSKDFVMLGNWYRQLMAESIGKDGIGITPTVSLGTTDLHSMLQLYLAGPKDKVTLFLSESNTDTNNIKNIENIKVPESSILTSDLKKVSGKSINFLKSIILKGVKAAYKKEKRPFLEVIFPKINELYLGQFLMFKMLEIVYLGKLLDINVFNQPKVEIYKKETKKYLNKLDI